MNNIFTRLIRRFSFLAMVLSAAAAQAGGYRNLSIAVYFRYQEVQSTPNNLAQFSTFMGERGKAGQGGQGLSRNHPQPRSSPRRPP